MPDIENRACLADPQSQAKQSILVQEFVFFMNRTFENTLPPLQLGVRCAMDPQNHLIKVIVGFIRSRSVNVMHFFLSRVNECALQMYDKIFFFAIQ